MKPISALCACLVCCGACGPVKDWKMPSNALRYASSTATEGPLRVSLLPIVGAAWQAQSTTDIDERWGRRLGYVRYVRVADRDLYLPLVPLPSLEVTLVNTGDTPILLDRAAISVTDSQNRTYEMATDVHEYLDDIQDPLEAVTPQLWLARLRHGRLADWIEPTTFTLPVLKPRGVEASRSLREAAEKVPLLGTRVVVPPRGAWVGALVFRPGTQSLEQLTEAMRGSLYVSMRGLRAGDVEIPPQVFTLPLDAHAREVVCANGGAVDDAAQCRPDVFTTPVEDGPCMERDSFVSRSVGVESVDRIWIDGTRVTQTDAFGALLAVPQSHRDAQRARKLRAAGSALLGAGIGASGVAMGTLLASDHGAVTLSGLSFLGVAAVGAGLNYLGYEKEMEAAREFNREAYETGTCAVPR